RADQGAAGRTFDGGPVGRDRRPGPRPRGPRDRGAGGGAGGAGARHDGGDPRGGDGGADADAVRLSYSSAVAFLSVELIRTPPPAAPSYSRRRPGRARGGWRAPAASAP